MSNTADNLDFSIPINSSKDNAKANTDMKPGATLINNEEGGQGAKGENKPQEQIDFTNFIRHANHPGVVLFTLLFKAASIVSFLFLNLFLSNEALTFIIVVIFSAFDFWFVKNVSGRILVGLRWWSEVKEDGTEVWIFESDHESKFKYNSPFYFIISKKD